MLIRPIEPGDNQEIAKLIRTVFREYKIDRPGTVYTDPTTDDLSGLFRETGSVYLVAEDNGILAGGCGIYPTPGLPSGCAELVKFYLATDFRGQGLGTELMDQCFRLAREMGYLRLYLESFPELDKALGMYERAGFVRLSSPLGHSGHFGCTIWMLKDL